MNFVQIVSYTDYGARPLVDGVLNFKMADVLCFWTPKKESWSDGNIYSYLRIRGNANPKAYLVLYEDLQTLIKKVDEQNLEWEKLIHK